MRARPILIIATSAVVLAGCGATSVSVTNPPSAADALTGNLTVFAASSLTNAFNTAEKGLEVDNPGFKGTYSYAGSQDLVTEIINGAPADVIATANTDTMAQLTAKGLVETPVAFCQNKLEIAVAPGNPLNIKTLADLNNPGVKLVVGDPSVPVGEYVTDIEASELADLPSGVAATQRCGCARAIGVRRRECGARVRDRHHRCRREGDRGADPGCSKQDRDL